MLRSSLTDAQRKLLEELDIDENDIRGEESLKICLMMRKYSPEFENKPLNRFLMANENDIRRIEKILFVDSRRC